MKIYEVSSVMYIMQSYCNNHFEFQLPDKKDYAGTGI